MRDTDRHALTRRVELFECHKKDKKYDQANEVYLEAIKWGRSQADTDEMLKLKASFADMQMTQGNYHEAEEVMSDILKWEDLPVNVERQCNEIRGKILSSRKRYSEAEDWYRKLYDRTSKDEWSLKMGDQMCQVIASQGDYELAQLEQVKLWENRKKSFGKDHPSTVKSALTAVDHLAKLIQKIPRTDEPNGSRSEKRMLAYEAEIEYILHDIWKSMSKGTQKQEAGMLKAGHELGRSLYNLGRLSEAEKVLQDVWQGRKAKLGDFDKDTLSTGLYLSQTMYMQGPERCRDAEKILDTIRDIGTTHRYELEDPIAKVADAHLAVAYSRLGEYVKAEELGKQSIFRTPARGLAYPPATLLRLALARALIGQGGHKAFEGRQLEAELGQSADPVLSPTQPQLVYGRMSTHGSLPWSGPKSEGLVMAPETFVNGRNSNDAGNYSTALGNGNSLLKAQNPSQNKVVLGQLWNSRVNGFEGNIERARYGDAYGLCLIDLGQYGEAKRVLKDVLAFKKRLYPGMPNQERHYTSELIKSIGQAGRGGNANIGTWPRSDLSSGLVRITPQTVLSGRRLHSKLPVRRKGPGFLEVLFS